MKKDSPIISVSVIVAAYNAEIFIGRCLRSLLNQSLNHNAYEIIVINDGSNDKTSYALDLFRDPYDKILKIINNKKNKGLPYSINRGIEEAAGKYVVRVDSDDFVNSNFLEILKLYIDMNEKCDAVASDYYLYDSKKEIIIKRMNCLKDPIACGIMFRKQKLFDIGLYDEDFFANEEKELRIRFEAVSKIHRLAMPLYRYRKHENNMTNDKNLMNKYKKLLQEKIIFQNEDKTLK